MAGIGFRLEKILKGDTYIDTVKAHFYSAIICSGPWILSILTLFCLNYFAPKNIDPYEILYFRSVLVYVFSFSLIASGLAHLALTRYVSDKLYVQEFDALAPVYNASTLVVCVFQALTGGIYVMNLDGGPLEKFLILMIYLAISMIWLNMVFLTALRDYQSIGIIYTLGSVIAVMGSVFLGKRMGLNGYLLGYLAGHLLIVVLLSARIFIEFPSERYFDRFILQAFTNNPCLVGVGLFYNLAIWIDKMVFWFSPRGVEVAHLMRVCPIYDSAVFFAYLTIIPSMSIFMIQIETDFYKEYRNYYRDILNKISYREIKANKKRLMESLQRGLVQVITFQGIITMLTVIFSPTLVSWLKMQAIQIPIFRITVIGAFLHSLFLIVLIMILYFDFQKLALAAAFVFMATNGLFAYLSQSAEISFLGYGYFFSSLISLGFAYYALDYQMKRLEYLTFAMQPVALHREEEII